MPDWLVEALEGFLEWVQELSEDIRSGLISFMVEMDWIHLSSLSWSSGQPLSEEFLLLAFVGYGLVIVVGGLVVMSHETLQTRYTIREIAPRLAAGLLLAGLSSTLLQQAMDVNNAIVDGFGVIAVEASPSGFDYIDDFPHKLDPESWENAEFDYLDCVEANGEDACEKPNVMVDILWILTTIICLLVLIFTSIVRAIAFFFVVVCAPVALACHGLPMTEWAATLWWRMLGACMASSIGQAALVWVYVKMTDGLYWGHLFHIQVVHIYLLVIVWMMWKVHQQAFRIARGRPLSIPGSRLVGAFVMSKVMDGLGRGKSPRNGDRRRPTQQRPNKPADRFPGLPPEPDGFKDWAGFRNDVDTRSAPSPSGAPTGGPVSPRERAASASVDGDPGIAGSTAPYAPAGDEAPRPNARPGATASTLDDTRPDPAMGTRPAPADGDQPLAAVPDGTLIERPESPPPVVQVRRDEAVPLATRREEARNANDRQNTEAAAAAAKARAQAEQQQAELRLKAAAAMARMAASPNSRPHTIPAAGPGHHAPPPPPGKSPGSGPALGSAKRPAGGER